MHLIALDITNTWTVDGLDAENGVLQLENTAELPHNPSSPRIELHFPKFTDGRAYTQATLLRRAGYRGDIRATGDVLIDQLLQMQRCGFSSAQLRADQKPELAERPLKQFAGFYQGDAKQVTPRFAAAQLEAA